MSDFRAKMHQIRFPLGELTALPQTAQLYLKGGEREEEGNERERKGRGFPSWGVWIRQWWYVLVFVFARSDKVSPV